jgi:hypothetical protein
MAPLPQIAVPDRERAGIDGTEQECDQGIEKPAFIRAGQKIGGFHGDDDQPDQGRNPGFQSFLSERIKSSISQARGRVSNSDWTVLRLLHRVIRRFASDHHVVHVALAESGNADTDKAGFLQKLRNTRTAAVTHA